MLRAGYIPLDRSDGRKAIKSLEEAAERIRNGRAIIIFPEGTRSLDGKLLPFKKGGFLLAKKAGVPIIPVTIKGSRDINPPGRFLIKRGVITIHFWPPIDPTETPKTEVLMNKVYQAIAGQVL
jgi:1-acyl-sn-glycerol-3-phosphate acyltransferase